MRLLTALLPVLAALAKAYTLPLECAANNGIMTTPTYGTTGAVFTVCAEVLINASPSTLYNVLIDYNRYPAWNTFVYLVDLPPGVLGPQDVYVGMQMTLHTSGLISPLNSTSVEPITYLEPDNVPAFLAWRYDGGLVGGLLMQAEHPSLMVDLGNGTSRHVSWETYYGAGALGTQLLLEKNLQTQFQNQANDLKARAESLA